MHSAQVPQDLVDRLDALEARLPQLIEDNPDPGDFWMAFAGESDCIEDAAGPHCAYVSERVSAMLSVHGRYLVDAELENI